MVASKRWPLAGSKGPSKIFPDSRSGENALGNSSALPWWLREDEGIPLPADVSSQAQIDDLIKSGKLVAGSRTNIMSSGIGVAVKRGAPKPDIGTVEAFKQTLLKAKSVTYLKEGASTMR